MKKFNSNQTGDLLED